MHYEREHRWDYVVTGAAGFIGRALVERLRNEQPNCTILEVDFPEQFLHPKLLRNTLGFNRPKVIYHLGAFSRTDNDNSQQLQEWNIEYTMWLVDWCATRSVRLVYASSAATYGDGEFGFGDDPETTKKLQPSSRYGLSKHLADLDYLKDHGEKPKITGCKFFNVFGRPHQEQYKDTQRSMIVQFLETASQGLPAKLFLPGWQYRDFVWIDDVLAVLRWLEDHPVPGLLNVGTGEPWSFAEVAAACYRKQGQPLCILWTEIPEKLRSQYQMKTKADISKLRRYGYDRPFLSVSEALSHIHTSEQS